MDIPMIYKHDGVLMSIQAGKIERLGLVPPLAILLSDVDYSGRYITIEEALSLRRIQYVPSTINTLDKALQICNLYNRSGVALQPYIYAEAKLSTTDMWIDCIPPVITTTDDAMLKATEYARLVYLFRNIHYDIATGRIAESDMTLIKLLHPEATMQDLAHVYSLI